MTQNFQIGVAFPTTEIGTDPIVIRDYVQAVEGMGFSLLIAYDHVLGADITNRPEWDLGAHPYTHTSAFYEPIVLFSYAAAVTTTLRFLSGVVILPQRQTVLFGKQAATLDVLCGGRLLLGVGLGWNKVEYDAVGEGLKFSARAARMEDQICFLRRLWCEPVLTADGAVHIVEAGINPLPKQQPIPIIIGGGSNAAMERAARIGDGWFPFLPASEARGAVATFQNAVIRAGRDPQSVAFYNNVLLGKTMGDGRVKPVGDAVAEVEAWRQAGATGLSLSTMDRGLASPDDHLELLGQIASALGLKGGATAR